MFNNNTKPPGHPLYPWENTAKVLSWLVAIFIVVYLPVITGFSISVDDEHAAYRTDPSIWVAQGRWASYLIELLFFRQSVAPYFPDLIFGLGAAAGYMAFMRRIDRHCLSNLPEVLLFGVFVGFPLWSFLAEFYSNLSAAGLGLALTCIAVASAKLNEHPNAQRGWWLPRRNILAGAVALATAIACYQSYLFFFASAGLALILIELKETRNVRPAWRLLGELIFVGVLGCVVYYVLWRIFMRVLHIEATYIQSFISFESLYSQPALILKRTFAEIGKVYGGSASVYMQPARSFAVLVVLAYASIIHAFRRSGMLLMLLSCFIFSVLLLIPFSLNPLSYGAVPYRSLVGAAFAMWFAGYVAVKWSPARVIPYAWIVVAVVVLQSIYTLSLSQAATTLVGERDRLLAQQIYSRIVAVNGDGAVGKVKPLEFYGALPFSSAYPKIISSTAGYSFFEWDGGNTYRIVRFMNLIGYGDVGAVAAPLRPELIPILWAMPLWPAQGSVKVVQGVTLVKLGAEPGAAQLALMDAVPFVPRGADIFYDSTTDNFTNVEVTGRHSKSDGALEVAAQPDPQVIVNLDSAAMRSCGKLQIHVEQRIAAASDLQVFFLHNAEHGFAEKNSQMRNQSSGFNTSNFFFSSAKGFGDKIRLDPVSGGQTAEIRQIEIGCLAPAQAGRE